MFSTFKCVSIYTYIHIYIGETTMLIPQIYPVCVIGPLSLKQAQLVPQVLKLNYISPFTNCH